MARQRVECEWCGRLVREDSASEVLEKGRLVYLCPACESARSTRHTVIAVVAGVAFFLALLLIPLIGRQIDSIINLLSR